MSPRGRGGGVHIIGGGDDGGSDVDPYTLNQYFSYATLGVYGLYFIYCIMVVLAQKTYFPYMYLYAIVTSALISSILTVVSILVAGGQSPSDMAAEVYFNLMLYLMWLFLFEPSRQINNLRQQPSTPTIISPLKLSQYTSSAVGIVVLCGYLWAILLVILNIVLSIAIFYVASPSLAGLNYFVVYAPWVFVLMWFFLAASHWQDIGDKRSYGLYGFFALCVQVGKTVVSSPGVFVNDSGFYAMVVVGFVMIPCCHFVALYFGFTKGSLWVVPSKYNFIKN